MAMIKCPNCGGNISDKADKCVHCGCLLSKYMKFKCKECGNLLEPGTIVCSNCGCPQEKKQDEKKKVGVRSVLSKLLLVISVLMILNGLFIFFYENQVNKFYEVRNESIDELNECKNMLLEVWENAI